ncbi:hypothetical protein [Microseira sp. BLCC-F43]|jgi:hypothetical protein|uniref:hypothetical protein n=1 Tax=Microseira sp. BLCC-F43 TaxID=3153602 RepID=UPI0035B72951
MGVTLDTEFKTRAKVSDRRVKQGSASLAASRIAGTRLSASRVIEDANNRNKQPLSPALCHMEQLRQ